MKKLILLVCVMCLFNCDLLKDTDIQLNSNNKIYYHDDFMGKDTPEKVIQYLNDNLYVVDVIPNDFQTVEDIFKRTAGDYLDYAICFLNIFYLNTGIMCDIAVLNYYYHPYNATKDVNSVGIIFNNNVYSIFNFSKINNNIIDVLEFKDIF